jgi:signal peptidase I
MSLLARARQGPWRVAVIEDSMAPAIQSGDWLLVDPTASRWPRTGCVVVFREPESDLLAVKRVAATAGAHVVVSEGVLHLEPGEAWLIGDSTDRSVDSRAYGPVSFDRFVGRAWFRYGPLRRVGRLRRQPPAG